MAWDTLQRWHETRHVDTSGYHITPPHLPGIPKYSPWAAIAQGLSQILPQLDPLEIAKRRLAMQQIPLQEANTKMELQYGIPAKQAQLQAMLRAYSSGDINPATGKPWTTQDRIRLEKIKEKHNLDSIYDRYAHWNTLDATVPTDQPPPENQTPVEIPEVIATP